MKVLILNGSPRPDGDTAYILEAVKNRFPGGTEFAALNTYEADIRPCDDCRYCWEKVVLIKDDYSRALEGLEDCLD